MLAHIREISPEQLNTAYALAAEIQSFLAVSAAVDDYKRTAAAIALDAVTALAEVAVLVAATVVEADHGDRMD